MNRLICRLFRGGHYRGPVTHVLDCDNGMFVLNAPCYCGSPDLHWGYGSSSDGGWKIEGPFAPKNRFMFMRRFRKYGVTP